MEAENNDGRRPLHWAAQGGSADTVRLLLEEGARYDSTDDRGRTPLMVSCASGAAGSTAAVSVLARKVMGRQA